MTKITVTKTVIDLDDGKPDAQAAEVTGHPLAPEDLESGADNIARQPTSLRVKGVK